MQHNIGIYIIPYLLPDDDPFRIETCTNDLRRSYVLVFYLALLLVLVLVFILFY